ncbi:MAG TPA: arginine--tRNA ligase [Coriobacteriia bacterium]|nr:arginine--tRNA ligase [Coriobacteriia bacterium]
MRDVISQLIATAIDEAVAEGALALAEVPAIDLERPRDESHGDWATSVALRAAKQAGMPPRNLAQMIADRVSGHEDIDAVEVAGPGFINLRLSPAALQRILREAREADSGFGRSNAGEGKRVQVEFVSANPVGPMHVGHGRWAALGDSIASILEHSGWVAEREFYINDAGVQMDVFGTSVAARYLELLGKPVDFPEEGYRGAYIAEIAAEVRAAEGDALAELPFGELSVRCRELGYELVLENHLRRVLHKMGVDFDVWFSERTLHAQREDGGTEIEDAIARLRERGYIFEQEGALWFRSTDYGDDKDRVLKKSDGEYTYFAADIAYHWDKLDVRGFDRVINIWGADHHGYVARMKAAVAALGHEDQLDIVIGQLVNLFRNGEAVRMSKRTGEMVTFEELLDEVGTDAARYWFLRRSTDQQVDFDIELAVKNSADNPVFYVQYAYARICSILRKAAGEMQGSERSADELSGALVAADTDLSLLTDPAELALVRKLGELPDVVAIAARDLAPYRLARYTEDLAASFHQFYTQCRVVSDDEALTAARLYAVDATRRALRCVLSLLGVSAPESM